MEADSTQCNESEHGGTSTTETATPEFSTEQRGCCQSDIPCEQQSSKKYKTQQTNSASQGQPTFLQGADIVLSRCDLIKCCQFKVHCPFCDVNHFKPALLARVRDHLNRSHFQHAVYLQGLMVVKCFHQCNHPAGHYHCPLCEKEILKRVAFTNHLRSHVRKLGYSSQTVQAPHPKQPEQVLYGGKSSQLCQSNCKGCKGKHYHCPDCSHESFIELPALIGHMWRCKESRPSWQQVLQSGETLKDLLDARLIEHITHPSQVPGFKWHKSVIRNLSDLPLARCTDTSCCDRRYHCPLCPVRKLKPNYIGYMQAHLLSHLRSGIMFKDYFILICYGMCNQSQKEVMDVADGQKKGKIFNSSFHFHCPVCGTTRVRKRHFIKHLKLCWNRRLKMNTDVLEQADVDANDDSGSDFEGHPHEEEDAVTDDLIRIVEDCMSSDRGDHQSAAISSYTEKYSESQDHSYSLDSSQPLPMQEMLVKPHAEINLDGNSSKNDHSTESAQLSGEISVQNCSSTHDCAEVETGQSLTECPVSESARICRQETMNNPSSGNEHLSVVNDQSESSLECGQSAQIETRDSCSPEMPTSDNCQVDDISGANIYLKTTGSSNTEIISYPLEKDPAADDHQSTVKEYCTTLKCKVVGVHSETEISCVEKDISAQNRNNSSRPCADSVDCTKPCRSSCTTSCHDSQDLSGNLWLPMSGHRPVAPVRRSCRERKRKRHFPLLTEEDTNTASTRTCKLDTLSPKQKTFNAMSIPALISSDQLTGDKTLRKTCGNMENFSSGSQTFSHCKDQNSRKLGKKHLLHPSSEQCGQEQPTIFDSNQTMLTTKQYRHSTRGVRIDFSALSSNRKSNDTSGHKPSRRHFTSGVVVEKTQTSEISQKDWISRPEIGHDTMNVLESVEKAPDNMPSNTEYTTRPEKMSSAEKITSAIKTNSPCTAKKAKMLEKIETPNSTQNVSNLSRKNNKNNQTCESVEFDNGLSSSSKNITVASGGNGDNDIVISDQVYDSIVEVRKKCRKMNQRVKKAGEKSDPVSPPWNQNLCHELRNLGENTTFFPKVMTFDETLKRGKSQRQTKVVSESPRKTSSGSSADNNSSKLGSSKGDDEKCGFHMDIMTNSTQAGHDQKHQCNRTVSCNTRNPESFSDSNTDTDKPPTKHSLTHLNSAGAKEPWNCQLCDFSSPSFPDVTAHLVTHHGYPNPPLTCDICEETFYRTSDLVSHLQLKHGPQQQVQCLTCQHCQASFTVQSQLDLHISRYHTKDWSKARPRLTCCICDHVAQTQLEMRAHMTSHKKEEIVCKICGKQFQKAVYLQTHIEALHTKTNACHCRQCGKYFSHVKYLSYHMKRHTGVKKHVCPICSWRFYENNTLRAHMETHKPKEERKYEFTCQYCDAKYRNKTNFRDHLNKHLGRKPHQCQQCGKCFTFRSLLTRHKLYTHSTDKPFACEICHKGFRFNSKLGEHMVTHTVISNHVCNNCAKAFSTRASLRQHFKKCKAEGFWHSQAKQSGNSEFVLGIPGKFPSTNLSPETPGVCRVKTETFAGPRLLGFHPEIPAGISQPLECLPTEHADKLTMVNRSVFTNATDMANAHRPTKIFMTGEGFINVSQGSGDVCIADLEHTESNTCFTQTVMDRENFNSNMKWPVNVAHANNDHYSEVQMCAMQQGESSMAVDVASVSNVSGGAAAHTASESDVSNWMGKVVNPGQASNYFVCSACQAKFDMLDVAQAHLITCQAAGSTVELSFPHSEPLRALQGPTASSEEVLILRDGTLSSSDHTYQIITENPMEQVPYHPMSSVEGSSGFVQIFSGQSSKVQEYHILSDKTEEEILGLVQSIARDQEKNTSVEIVIQENSFKE